MNVRFCSSMLSSIVFRVSNNSIRKRLIAKTTVCSTSRIFNCQQLSYLSTTSTITNCSHNNFPYHNLWLKTSLRQLQRHLSSSSFSDQTTSAMYSWDNLPKPNVIFVLGPPGAGKGTQCSLICKEYGYVHLSAGDLLRKEQTTPGSEYGSLIDEHIRNGTIVPVEITCSLLEKAMLEHMTSLAESCAGDESIPAGNILIDGFPRNQNNLDGWKRQVADKVNVQFILFFECPKDVAINRCLKRGQHSGRADDNPESMAKRLDTYLNQTMPIVEHYEKMGLVRRIDSSRPIKLVFDDVKKLF